MRSRHEALMVNANRVVDVARIASVGALSNELLEAGYAECWYAYQHASRMVRRYDSQRNWRVADTWREKREYYMKTRLLVWDEMVRRGLHQETGIGETRRLEA